MKEKPKTNIFRLLWKMITYRPWLYTANIILWTSIYTYHIFPSLLIRRFFNSLSNNEPNSQLLWVLALIVGIALGRVVLGHLGGLCDVVNKFSVKFLIGRNMLEGILRKPGAKAIPVSPGEALNCFRDDLEQAEITLSWFLDTIGAAVFAIIAIVILISINPFITVFVFTPLVAVVTLAKKAGSRIEKNRRESRKTTASIIGVLEEIFGAVQGVKVSGAEKNIIGHIRNLNKARHRTMLKDIVFNQLLSSVYHNIVSLGTGLILLLVAQSMKTGSFSVGDFALFVYYLAFVADFTMMFGDFMAFLKQTDISFERMAALLETDEPESLIEHNPIYLKGDIHEPKYDKPNEDEDFNKIELRNLSYNYPNSQNGIKDISFTIPKGSFTVITGRIGSGKTTLLKTLLGLLPIDKGSIIWNDKSIDNVDRFMIPPKVAYTGQVPHLFSDTIGENIKLGLPKERVDMEAAIYSAVLEKDILNLECGIDTIVGPRGVKLSGGQIQRVAAARMFARNADLFVFDDISSALDIETENTLWKRLFDKQGETCLVVSNKKPAIQRADHIIVLKDGSIEAQGKFEDLISNCEEFQKIWGKE